MSSCFGTSRAPSSCTFSLRSSKTRYQAATFFFSLLVLIEGSGCSCRNWVAHS